MSTRRLLKFVVVLPTVDVAAENRVSRFTVNAYITTNDEIKLDDNFDIAADVNFVVSHDTNDKVLANLVKVISVGIRNQVLADNSVSDADLAAATQDFFRRTVEGLGGELIEYSVTLQAPEDLLSV